MNDKITQAERAYNDAVEARDAAYQAIEEMAADADADAVDQAVETFEDAQASVDRAAENVSRLEAIRDARNNTPPIVVTASNTSTNSSTASAGTWHASAKGERKQEHTYRPDVQHNFWRDLLSSRSGDIEARERLNRSQAESIDMLGVQYRDMQNASTQGAEFLPPLYLSELYVEPNIAARPFADALPKLALPPSGTSITIPQLSSGVAVAARADAGTVQETDGVTASITHDVNEIAGQVDIGRIAVMRSDPGLDVIITRTLRRRYDAYLDTQLLAGSGSAPQHRGIRAVSGVNTVSYTDASPTAAELVPKIYDAIQKIASTRLEEFADTIVLHPRRAAWLASNLSSTFPLFQLGALNQAAGGQSAGFVNNFAGLNVVLDANIATNYGASTNEDEIYVVAASDLYLMEGPLFARVFEDVGSGTGVVRYQVFAHSAFLSKRYPASITVVSGTGLVTPTF